MSADDLITQVHQPEERPKQQRGFCWYLCCGPCRPNTAVQQIAQHGGSTAPSANTGATELPPQPGRAPPQKFLLPPLKAEQSHMKCLVLDLDETLVHSSFKPIPDPDFTVDIELDGAIHRVYVRKRPGVDHFLREVGKKFEIVVFTASLAKYADPLLDVLDKDHVVQFRLFREACVQHYGNYVKDLTHLGRVLESSIIVDNSPFSYMFQPDNAIPIATWFHDKNDRQLYDLLPFLDTLAQEADVVSVLQRKNFDFLTNPAPSTP
jgi:RNA polymerase II subunit A small phosphatase-like protein